MKRIIGIVIGAAIIFFLVLGIARTQQKEEVLSISKIQQREGVPVLASTVQQGQVRKLQSYYGTVRAKKQADISAKLMERVESVLVDEGDHVNEGDVLVRYDASASQVQVSQARLHYLNMKRDYERMKSLLEEGAISQQTFDQTELGYEVARENYETARRSVELMAPISGMVARVNVTEGVVSNPGDIVVQIVAEDAFEVEFDATQEDRPLLKPGLDVIVHTRGSEELVGKLTKVSYATSLMTRLFTVYADIPPSDALYPGVLATVDVIVEERDNVVAVPLEAVLDRGHGPEVIVIEDGTAHVRKVSLGLTGADLVEIEDGLQLGETIATYGHGTLEDGVKVKIIRDENTTAGDIEG
jgi:membrane fusion protein (multidrug efflux system)